MTRGSAASWQHRIGRTSRVSRGTPFASFSALRRSPPGARGRGLGYTGGSIELKLAGADFAFPLLSHGSSLRLIAILGLKGVDIGLFEERSHLYSSHVLADPQASSADLVACVTDKGLAIADIFLQTAGFDVMTVNYPDAAQRRGSRDLFERTLEFAQLCGT